MGDLQFIRLNGEAVAVVVGVNQAIVSPSLGRDRERIVKRMCVYAMQVADGERCGPYSDAEAEAFAQGG